MAADSPCPSGVPGRWPVAGGRHKPPFASSWNRVPPCSLEAHPSSCRRGRTGTGARHLTTVNTQEPGAGRCRPEEPSRGAGLGWSHAPHQIPTSHWPVCLSVCPALVRASFSATSARVGRSPGRASRSWRRLPGAYGRPGREAPGSSITGCSGAASLPAAPPGAGQGPVRRGEGGLVWGGVGAGLSAPGAARAARLAGG